jgi:magnesium chelatase family protein
MDRMDIHIEVPSVRFQDLTNQDIGESSRDIRIRVNRAREIQIERFKGQRLHANARMGARHLKKYCVIDEPSQALLEQAMEYLVLSARAYTRILKISRTIADLEGSGPIQAQHVAEAIQYRSFDRKFI